MKSIYTILFLSTFVSWSQMTYEKASELSRNYEVYAYSYFEGFAGKPGYAASVILTNDGGCAFLGDWYEDESHGPLLIKLDSAGNEQWKLKLKGGYDESEPQGIVQDTKGNFYIFALVYSNSGYRGGCERVISVSPTGKMTWDKLIGGFTLINRPTFAFVRSHENGKIELRGHIVKEVPEEGKDPDYYYWSAWLSADGSIEQTTGQLINWSTDKWQDWYKAE